MELMLAHRGQPADIPRLQHSGHLFDLKIDGVRCLATINEGVVTLTNRRGSDFTARYPEVTQALAAAHPTGLLVLDGEIAVCDDQGLPSWPLTHKRDAQQNQITRWAEHMPATFFAFDLLQAGITDWRRLGFAERRTMLTNPQVMPQSQRIKPVLCTTDGEALWDLVCQHQLEGVIAKNPNSPYYPGRSRDWIKIKRTATATCLVGGYDPGEGWREQFFGALHLYLLDDQQHLVPVGKVGSGFTNTNLRRVKARLSRPPLIIEVEYLDVQSGVMRQPVFKGIRDDVDITACTLDQLT